MGPPPKLGLSSVLSTWMLKFREAELGKIVSESIAL